jgi:hypothetical protein
MRDSRPPRPRLQWQPPACHARQHDQRLLALPRCQGRAESERLPGEGGPREREACARPRVRELRDTSKPIALDEHPALRAARDPVQALVSKADHRRWHGWAEQAAGVRAVERCAYCSFVTSGPLEEARQAFTEHVCDSRPRPTSQVKLSGKDYRCLSLNRCRGGWSRLLALPCCETRTAIRAVACARRSRTSRGARGTPRASAQGRRRRRARQLRSRRRYETAGRRARTRRG